MSKLNPFLNLSNPVKFTKEVDKCWRDEFDSFYQVTTTIKLCHSYTRVNLKLDRLPDTLEGYELLHYIISNLELNRDTMEIDKEEFNDLIDIDSAIADLVLIGLIQLKSSSVYWVNPLKIFKGSLYDYLLKKQQKYPDFKILEEAL